MADVIHVTYLFFTFFSLNKKARILEYVLFIFGRMFSAVVCDLHLFF